MAYNGHITVLLYTFIFSKFSYSLFPLTYPLYVYIIFVRQAREYKRRLDIVTLISREKKTVLIFSIFLNIFPNIAVMKNVMVPILSPQGINMSERKKVNPMHDSNPRPRDHILSF